MNRSEYHKQWREKNKEHLRAYMRDWIKKNPDKKKSHNLKYKTENSTKLKIYYSEYGKANPEKRRTNWHRRRARLRAADGSFTKKQWEELKHIFNNTCYMCNRMEPEIKLTIDHKIPLSLRGNNFIDNIQPLCFSCNARKRNTIWFARCPLKIVAV